MRTYVVPTFKGCDNCDGSSCGKPIKKTSTIDGYTETYWQVYCKLCKQIVKMDDPVKLAKNTVSDPPKPRATNDKIGLRDLWIESSINTDHFYTEALIGLKERCEREGVPEQYMVIEPLKRAPAVGVVDEAFRMSKEKYEMAVKDEIEQETNREVD